MRGDKLAEYPSRSKPGRMYTIRLGSDGTTYCDCWQWKINKTCKHLEQYFATERQREFTEKQLEIAQNPIQHAIDEAVAFMKGAE